MGGISGYGVPSRTGIVEVSSLVKTVVKALLIKFALDCGSLKTIPFSCRVVTPQ